MSLGGLIERVEVVCVPGIDGEVVVGLELDHRVEPAVSNRERAEVDLRGP